MTQVRCPTCAQLRDHDAIEAHMEIAHSRPLKRWPSPGNSEQVMRWVEEWTEELSEGHPRSSVRGELRRFTTRRRVITAGIWGLLLLAGILVVLAAISQVSRALG
jgi:hypothetical protein